ncbi:MAG: hypothetical protein AB8G11_16085 [Saprospiraceae bacterium]
MTIKLLLTTLGVLLCINIFAQTSTFQKGTIHLKDNDEISGYIALVDKFTIAFKLSKDTDFQKYFISEEVADFSYNSKKYRTIEYNSSTIFVYELEQGNINLYEETFSKNENERYFIEIDKNILNLSKSTYYDILKKYIGDLSLFNQYDQEMFLVAFEFNQDDLKYLINHYNQQFVSIISEPNRSNDGNRDKGNIIYKRKPLEMDKSPQIPNSVRNELVLKTEVLYNQILEALKQEDWKKINIALNLLKPLGKEIESYDNNQLYHQLLVTAKEKKTSEFRKVFITFVSTGLQSLMNIASQQSEITIRKFIIRQAFVEFLEIKSVLQKADADLTNQITNQFRMIFAKAKIPEQFKSETTKIINFFSSIVSKI